MRINLNLITLKDLLIFTEEKKKKISECSYASHYIIFETTKELISKSDTFKHYCYDNNVAN
jgi:hypothetical protein